MMGENAIELTQSDVSNLQLQNSLAELETTKPKPVNYFI